MADYSNTYDVLVIGGGNAALCAAITAAEAGATVLLLESAPRPFRGGNSRHTRNLRCMHDAPLHTLTEAYPEEEFFQDLLKVTGGETSEPLARQTIRGSVASLPWMIQHGVRFQPSLGGTLHLSRTNAFFLGGGRTLLNSYYRCAESLGVEALYEAEVEALEMQDGVFQSAVFRHAGASHRVRAKAVVVASGGFQANLEWLKEAWGPPAENFIIRGTGYNRGRMLRELLDHGAKGIGDPTQCHAVAIDARSPKYDGGIVTRVDAVSLGIVVNKHAKRFYDEGEDFWPKRYAIWGRLVAGQPDQIAYSIIDSKVVGRFMPPVFPPVKGNSIAELAAAVGLDAAALGQTVAEFNAAVVPGQFDHNVLDNCATREITPPKTHWAQPIDTAPFFAYPLRPGITFTYLSVVVNERAKIIMQDDKPSTNMYAAGEIMSGNVLGKGYLGGFGMALGTVFGRVAGQEAASHAGK